LNERDSKLVEWLGEAHAKEAELEADLGAHIKLTDKRSYKNRLRKHLTETRAHKRQVASRIKKLGGDAPSARGGPVGEVAGKAVAAVKGQVGTARAALTDKVETHLRNAQEELREEHLEVALYTRIEAFASAVGDRDTERLAKQIRRDEERMAKFLEAELGRLVKELVRSEIPRDQRAQASARSRRRVSAGAARSSNSGSRSRSSSGGGSPRSSGSGSPSNSGGSRSRSNSAGSGSRSRSGSRGTSGSS
jgi:ferritin-like metal-binding protein YciE